MSQTSKSSPANSNKPPPLKAAKKNKNSFICCLNRARDIYVNTFCGCAGGASSGSKRGGSRPRGGSRRFTAGVAVLMPRARSNAFGHSNRLGDDNDFADLVRANSKRNAAAEAAAAAAAAAVVVVARSQSTAPSIGRIDEERSLEFDGDAKQGMIGTRSQSCTVAPPGGKLVRGRV